MAFIRLTKTDDLDVVVNVNDITSITDAGLARIVRCKGGVTHEVKESLDEVLEHIYPTGDFDL